MRKILLVLTAFLHLSAPLYAADIDADQDSNDDLDIAYGGTNASTAAGARTNLGVYSTSEIDSAIDGLLEKTGGAMTGTLELGVASTTTGLLQFYNSSKAYPFGLFSLGADAPSVGWRLPATLPAGTYLVTVDTNGYMDYLDPGSLGGGSTELDALTDVTGEGTVDYVLYDDGDGTYSFRAAPTGSFSWPASDSNYYGAYNGAWADLSTVYQTTSGLKAEIEGFATLDLSGIGTLSLPTNVVLEDSTDTLTNKTVDAASNTITIPLLGTLDGSITDPADADDMIYAHSQGAITITDIHCVAEGGGTITITLQECDNATCASPSTVENAITCDSDGAEDDGTLTDGSGAAGAWYKMLFGAPSGTVNSLAWAVYGSQTL